MIQVVPAIIPKSFDDLAEKVERVQEHVSLVQIDVVDGAYAPVTTWPFNEGADGDFEALVGGEKQLPFADAVHFEVDLMVRAPEILLDSWISAGFSHVIVHIESTDALGEIVARLRAAGRGIGLALKPSTPNSIVEPWISRIDFIQFMGNDKVGYHGVELDPRVIEKVRTLRDDFPSIPIAVDIGVNETTAPQLVQAGVTKLVSGSAIFNSNTVPDAIARLTAA